jgi:hypothetical protein
MVHIILNLISGLERAVDARISIIRVLETMPTSHLLLSSVIVQGLLPLFAKESNELAVAAMIDAMMVHQGVLLKEDSLIDEKASRLILSGTTDKRNRVKSAWAVAISQVIWSIEDPQKVNSTIVSFSKSIAKPLRNAFNEIASNAVQALQNGTLVSGYAISAATIGRWIDWEAGDLGNPLQDPSHAKHASQKQKESSISPFRSPQRHHFFSTIEYTLN